MSKKYWALHYGMGVLGVVSVGFNLFNWEWMTVGFISSCLYHFFVYKKVVK